MSGPEEVSTGAIGTVDFDGARVYAIPMRVRFRGIAIREGMLIEGPGGWGEFCPVADDDGGAAQPVRDHVPINGTVPAVNPERAHEITAGSGCRTAKVKVADHPESLFEDLARV